ncbi:hypothetical protein [Pseudomonas sp. PSKL.D1]|uniref:hypothetical protein n=1 Tax=Pseudomonas sp. PSKL.D1 TaxID=3029060 RepID=UPI0023818DC6|nr:hypothetical protein [Pseudomonas sp. PSKL.D1]WDY59891.1 hypothetical protein PVV54_09810 [Pseudomonas sp. PSKL.D1]
MTKTLVSLAYSDANLIGLGANLSEEELGDVQCLLNHAESFADRSYNRHELWKSWFDHVRNRMEKHGCTRLATLEHPAQVINDFADFDDQLAPIGAGSTPAVLAALARDALGELRGTQDAKRFLERGTEDGRSSTFLVTPCQKDEDGQIHLAVYAFRMNASVEIRDFDFWSETQREIVVWNIGTAYRFDPTRFANVREQLLLDLARWSCHSLTRIKLK